MMEVCNNAKSKCLLFTPKISHNSNRPFLSFPGRRESTRKVTTLECHYDLLWTEYQQVYYKAWNDNLVLPANLAWTACDLLADSLRPQSKIHVVAGKFSWTCTPAADNLVSMKRRILIFLRGCDEQVYIWQIF